MSAPYDVAAIGNAIVDVIAPAEESFLVGNALTKGSMMLIDEPRAHELYGKMSAAIEASGGSAGNTVAGVASLGGSAAYIGKVAADQLGDVFAHDTRQIGVRFETGRLTGGAATGRRLDQRHARRRAHHVHLPRSASVELTAADVDADLIMGAQIVYLEGYLFDPPEARRAFAKAADWRETSGRAPSALTLSDLFVVERHRAGSARIYRDRGRSAARQRGRDHLAVRSQRPSRRPRAPFRA